MGGPDRCALDASWAPRPDAAIFDGTAVAFLAQGLRLIEFWAVWLIGVPLRIASGPCLSAPVRSAFAVLVGYGRWTWGRSRRTAATGSLLPSCR